MWQPRPVSPRRKAGSVAVSVLALARLHLGDVPFKEGDATLNLHREMLEPELAAGRFADEGERFGQ